MACLSGHWYWLIDSAFVEMTKAEFFAYLPRTVLLCPPVDAPACAPELGVGEDAPVVAGTPLLKPTLPPPPELLPLLLEPPPLLPAFATEPPPPEKPPPPP